MSNYKIDYGAMGWNSCAEIICGFYTRAVREEFPCSGV